MVYQPIRSSDDLAARLVPGVTREDHWLDFKGLDAATGRPYTPNDKGREECRLDVAAFANEDGGTIVIGAEETNHVLARLIPVPNAQELVRWIDEVLKEKLEPRPAIEPYVLQTPAGGDVVTVNIPPSLRLIALHSDNWYAFPVRTADSRRYLTLAEVEARMQDRDRMHRLRLRQIDPRTQVGLDAWIDTALHYNGWRVEHVEEDAVIISRDTQKVSVPLAYVETVYQAGLPGAEWIVALSCHLSKHRRLETIVVTKESPPGRGAHEHQRRGLD